MIPLPCRPDFVCQGTRSLLAVVLLAGLTACGDDGGATCANPGGPVAAEPNDHCGTTVQPTEEAACHLPDAGPGAPDAGPEEEDPPAVAGTEGDDDDCKYHMAWSASTVCENQGVTFTLHLTRKQDSAPATGAAPYIEAFLDETHPAPNSDASSTETSPGVYTIGPMRFDAPGRWSVRFHVYGDCEDGETSPHSHAAYFVDVP